MEHQDRIINSIIDRLITPHVVLNEKLPRPDDEDRVLDAISENLRNVPPGTGGHIVFFEVNGKVVTKFVQQEDLKSVIEFLNLKSENKNELVRLEEGEWEKYMETYNSIKSKPAKYLKRILQVRSILKENG